ncbi:MAG: prolyl-tRNA synthetase associated domain-containing protein [Candidatus Aminicenantes bacterium]|nr:prolyl-tRNA synthetase associated domain-containing protein [Candidatus Aminicenantes bacterium]
MKEKEKEVYDVLTGLGIPFKRFEHPPVFTVEEAEKYWHNIKGIHCKNLFLRNKKGTVHYLVIIEAAKRIDLKKLTHLLHEDRLSFASEERLKRFLGLSPGAVSPFGLLYDNKNLVRVFIDEGLKKADAVCFHPNVNTATVLIPKDGFLKFLEKNGNPYHFVSL